MLDAEFDIELSFYGVDIVLHSRSGGSNAVASRNVEYFLALETILARLATIDGRILSIAVDSVVARRLAVEDRVIALDYPIRLAGEPDLLALRRRITEGQRKIASQAKTGGHRGNNHKRIRIAVDLVTTPADVRGLYTVLEVVDPIPHTSTRTYRRAAASPSVRPADLFTFDPAAREKALAAHAQIQNGLADFLETVGRSPFSPGDDEPDYDLAWIDGSTIHVVEVKSLSGVSATHQMRLGVGQVLHYRQALGLSHADAVAVLAVEYEPDSIWQGVCADVDVRLTWPPDWPGIEL
ncbi:MAG: hypothetical protein QOD39_930 [Mycobacterium sp.]|nr:hypothetical protein [Mycobacterium sp.]